MVKQRQLRSIIIASSVGTLIEWYDFYIFGSLAIVISTKYFPSSDPTAAFLSTLATFAAGFVIRPFGALVFGRLGDLVGRKFTFMITLLLMGGATFLIGCIPTYEKIGFWAPAFVLLLRLLQGLALGGEYGGAAIYVAEHAPPHQRGYYTSWIQITATAGLLLSLMVILITRQLLGPDTFDEWGWRVPFWVSSIMVGISYFIRNNMSESPVFEKMKQEGNRSKNPIKDSFGNVHNLKFVLLALFGVTMGQGVIWYTGQFYAMSFIGKVCSVASEQTDTLMAFALLAASPFFVVFGKLSDKVGRKWVMLFGILLAILFYYPIYQKIYRTIDVKEKSELLEKKSISREASILNGHASDSLIKTTSVRFYDDGSKLQIIQRDSLINGEWHTPKEAVRTVYLSNANYWIIAFLVFIQVLFVTMVYGPIAAFLVELFPAKIRYTSMSLPYHVGNGIFGGLLPAVSTYFVNNAKSSGVQQWYLNGLWYPISIGALCFIIGAIYLKNKQSNFHE